MQGIVSVFDAAKIAGAKVEKSFLAILELTVKNYAAHSNKITAINDILGDNTAHNMENINGLQTGLVSIELDITNLQTLVTNLGTTKQNKLTGYSGSYLVVTSVNFASSTVTTKTITVVNGVITSVV